MTSMLRSAVLSTRSPAFRVSLRVVCASPRRQPVRLPSLQSARPFSLASLFGRPNPKSIPSPQVVALITRLEADANVSPHDVDKQLALFRALVDTRMPSSYELVVTRWDRMCEFVRRLVFLFYFFMFIQLRMPLRLSSTRQTLFNSTLGALSISVRKTS